MQKRLASLNHVHRYIIRPRMWTLFLPVFRDGQHAPRVTWVAFRAWLNSPVAKRGAEVSLSLHIVALLELKGLLSSPASPQSPLLSASLLSQIFQSRAKSRSLSLSAWFCGAVLLPSTPNYYASVLSSQGGQKFMIFHFGGGESGTEKPVMSHVAALWRQLKQ